VPQHEVRQGLAALQQKRRVSRSSTQIEDWRGILDSGCFQALSRGWRGLGDLPDGAVRAQQLCELDALEVIVAVPRYVSSCPSSGKPWMSAPTIC
jgi:hypothetical protein